MEHTLELTDHEALVWAIDPITSGAVVDLVAIKAFIVLQLCGGIGLIVLLLSASLSRTKAIQRLMVNASSSSIGPINRSRTWFSFCISWIISCFSYCLLFFAREQFNQNETPAYGLCMVQAALIYSSPPLTGATSFALFLDVWWMFRASAMGKQSGGSTAMISLLVAPYIFWVILTLGFLIAGGVHPEMVHRDLAVDPYCVLSHPVPPILVCSLTLAFSLAILVMLVILAVGMHRFRIQVEGSSFHPSRSGRLGIRLPGDNGNDNQRKSSYSRNRSQILALIVRLIVFGILCLLGVAISTIFVYNRAAGPLVDLAMSMLPPAGVVIFGTQKDFLLLWSTLIQWSIQRMTSCSRQTTLIRDNNSKDPPLSPNKAVEMEVELAPTDVLDIGRGSGAFLVLPRDEEEVLVSPRRVY